MSVCSTMNTMLVEKLREPKPASKLTNPPNQNTGINPSPSANLESCS